MLRTLDTLQDVVGVSEERGGFLKREQMLINIFNHRVGVPSCRLIDAGEIPGVFLAEFQETLSPYQLLLGDISTD